MADVAGDSPSRYENHMRHALAIAANGLGLASPNPMVGAVVVAGDQVIGHGWHEGPGTPHAEIVALQEAGPAARGATLVVTLEPCAHHGRTPPCALAVRDAGIARVVAAMRDPNPMVDGKGFEVLRAAGVDVVEGVLADEAERLVAAFVHHIRTGRPMVTLKMAASLDGKVAARDGSSRWITGEKARLDAHHLRAASDAIVVGSATALADDPSLTVRLAGYRGRQPLRVLADGSGRVPAAGALFDGSAPTMVMTTTRAPDERRDEWARAGAQVCVLEEGADGTAGIVQALGGRDVQSVLIEGGPTLAWSAVRDGVVDRFVLYLAPKLIGGSAAPGILTGDGVGSVTDAIPLKITEVRRIGEDVKVVADVHRDR